MTRVCWSCSSCKPWERGRGRTVSVICRHWIANKTLQPLFSMSMAMCACTAPHSLHYFDGQGVGGGGGGAGRWNMLLALLGVSWKYNWIPYTVTLPLALGLSGTVHVLRSGAWKGSCDSKLPGLAPATGWHLASDTAEFYFFLKAARPCRSSAWIRSALSFFCHEGGKG